MASWSAADDGEIGSKGTGEEFYAWCARGELRLRRCRACREWCHVPRVTCPNCASTEWAWERVKGTGRVFTWTVVHRAMHPAFADAVPYAVVVVELDEGPRIVSGLVDCRPEELVMEMPVEVVFEADDRLGERVLPRFRPTGGERASAGTAARGAKR
ncbi:MAG: OB-fold domain-containing protein [Myxococcota bacterium]